MYNNELTLFQRSNESIWTDEYISKSLLHDHLDESSDAASRKSSRRLEIIRWINARIKTNSRIIDFGCGPGLYAYELGKMGHNVLGIDFNKESINYARSNKSIKGIVEYKYSNYLQDQFDGKYNAAMMIFCDFGALIPNEQRTVLKKINSLLEDDGIFVFDVFGKAEMKNQQDKRCWYILNGMDFWNGAPYLLLEERKLFEQENTLGTRYYLVDQTTGIIKECIMWDQYYDEDSIQNLLSENGFEVLEIDKGIIKYKEETLLVIARKK
jgi:SAM-dependent methyltransferase